MFIRLGYDIEFDLPAPLTMLALLYVHPSRHGHLLRPDVLRTDPVVPVESFIDSFGNRCARLDAPAGRLRLYNETLIRDSGFPDRLNLGARQVPVQVLPPDVLPFLLPSRYCEVDLLNDFAWEQFGDAEPGWARAQAVCDFVHAKVRFGYQHARPTRTATEVLAEGVGVCRDFQHLAVTLCRCLNIPARYVTGYLGDIGVPPNPSPMDFSAWFEAYLDGEWYTFDARHNAPRIGRVLMATGRDAADCAITTSFGTALLRKFEVITAEVTEDPSEGQLQASIEIRELAGAEA